MFLWSVGGRPDRVTSHHKRRQCSVIELNTAATRGSNGDQLCWGSQLSNMGPTAASRSALRQLVNINHINDSYQKAGSNRWASGSMPGDFMWDRSGRTVWSSRNSRLGSYLVRTCAMPQDMGPVAVKNIRISLNSGNVFDSLATVSFYRRAQLHGVTLVGVQLLLNCWIMEL
jgi:hypothetical protein